LIELVGGAAQGIPDTGPFMVGAFFEAWLVTDHAVVLAEQHVYDDGLVGKVFRELAKHNREAAQRLFVALRGAESKVGVSDAQVIAATNQNPRDVLPRLSLWSHE
jgi:hypothetical protein